MSLRPTSLNPAAKSYTPLRPTSLNPAAESYTPLGKFSFGSTLYDVQNPDRYKLRHGRCMTSEKAAALRKLLMNKSSKKGAGFKWNDRKSLGPKQLANIRDFLNGTFDDSRLDEAQKETLAAARQKIAGRLNIAPKAEDIEMFYRTKCQDVVEAIICRWLRPSELMIMFKDQMGDKVFRGKQEFSLPAGRPGREIMSKIIGRQGAFLKYLTERYNALYIYAKNLTDSGRINVYAFSEGECASILATIRRKIDQEMRAKKVTDYTTNAPVPTKLSLKAGLAQVEASTSAPRASSRRPLPPIQENAPVPRAGATLRATTARRPRREPAVPSRPASATPRVLSARARLPSALSRSRAAPGANSAINRGKLTGRNSGRK